MAVVFTAGQTLGRGDLDIFLTNAEGNAANAAQITYAIYWVDPDPPYPEVLIGSATRTPMNPAVGEYYAAFNVPPGATPGDYRIRWTFRQLTNSGEQEVIQEWAVSPPGAAPLVTTYSPAVKGMVDKLRMLLRDQCLGGESRVEVDVDGVRMELTLEELHDAVGDLSPPGT